VRPAVDLDHVPAAVEVVIDAVGVGNEVAVVAGEDIVDRVARVLRRVLEQDVAPRRDHHPEVARAALVLVLHEHAGRVDAEVRLREAVETHRLDERLGELRERAVPAAHRRARELEPVACVDAFESMERQVILPPLDDRVGEHSGAREPLGNRQLRRLADQNRRLGIVLSVFGNELRARRERQPLRPGVFRWFR